MKELIQINYKKKEFSELSSADQQLVAKAQEAMKGAHAPYSRFHVGSAVLLQDDTVVTGNNQENAAYPSGLCAERVALFAAKSHSRQEIQAIAIVAGNEQNGPADAFACGSCRQVMMEYASLQADPIRVIMGTHEGTFILLEDSKSLMPFNFDSRNLL